MPFPTDSDWDAGIVVPAPTSISAQAYLAPMQGEWDVSDIEKAFVAEKASQRKRCRVPDDILDAWPADLVEALHRRVAHNLALRALPLGLDSSIGELGVSQQRVGGLDAEVRRLEAPYRKLVVG